MKNKIKTQIGFTLIELLVVLAIIIIITSMVLVGFNRFGNKITLQNVTYKVALSIREAQLYGVAGKFQNENTFTAIPVGVYINKIPVPGEYAASYIIFSDINPQNNKYDAESVNPKETVEINKLIGGYSIYSMRARRAGGNNNDFVNLNEAYIMFQRPEPDAKILDQDGALYDLLEIVIQSPQGDRLKIIVNASGLISVQRVIN